MELELVRSCPWRSGRRHVSNAVELGAHIAYHQVAEIGGRFVSGYLSLKGEEEDLEEWEAHLHPKVFRCVMGSERVLFRPREEGSTIPFARFESSEVSPTLSQEFARCMRLAWEGGEPMMTDRFSPPLAFGLRGCAETGPRDKGKMLNVLFRAVTALLWENADLEARLLAAVQEGREVAVEKSPDSTPLQDGAEEGASCPEKPEEKGGASGELVGIHPATPPTEVTSLLAAPPPYYGEGASSGELHPSLLPDAAAALTAACPAAASSRVIGVQDAVCTTYHTRTWTELQELCRGSKIKPDETLAIWLGRLVVEFGSDLLDLEEASFLTRQASWSGGHATDVDLVPCNAHWPIPLPALVTGQVDYKSHAWHDSRPSRVNAEQILLAIIGSSYGSWNSQVHALGLTPPQQRGLWPHCHLRNPGTVPVTSNNVEARVEVYGGRNATILQILLNPLAGQPACNLLRQLPRLQALMKSDTGTSSDSEQVWQPPQRTPEERIMFGFLLLRSRLSKRQLRILGDEGQWQLAYELGFQCPGEPDDESGTFSSH
ncbi:uncharacterized protein LOC132251164 isoform X1 [Alligator mississippiensis]|uniref:uncharacterized protein LOC132251164 isoform X1 n=1 Tax=Alligator mississippiensis TaxID=8496 RepID=UPI002877D5F4|nr:uncharacterized protein LOC132251164 isoform X1 [Alligator mississippiensis]XP_059585847.1 uncharacterized protein LOC132251164 isoform X1 [Alligator mississippiensis]XP_059585848.1 uncharacterized protein LOC132251164 isoform X1 [Alligator mississippiensis]